MIQKSAYASISTAPMLWRLIVPWSRLRARLRYWWFWMWVSPYNNAPSCFLQQCKSLSPSYLTTRSVDKNSQGLLVWYGLYFDWECGEFCDEDRQSLSLNFTLDMYSISNSVSSTNHATNLPEESSNILPSECSINSFLGWAWKYRRNLLASVTNANANTQFLDIWLCHLSIHDPHGILVLRQHLSL